MELKIIQSGLHELSGIPHEIYITPVFEVYSNGIFDYYLRTQCKKIEEETVSFNQYYLPFYQNEIANFPGKEERMRISKKLTSIFYTCGCPEFISIYIPFDTSKVAEETEYDEKKTFAFLTKLLKDATNDIPLSVFLMVSHLRQFEKGNNNTIHYPHYHTLIKINDLKNQQYCDVFYRFITALKKEWNSCDIIDREAKEQLL